MLWVLFNKNGQVVYRVNAAGTSGSQNYFGGLPYAGTTNYQIYAVFQDIDIDHYGSASVKFYKPDLQRKNYWPLLMTKLSEGVVYKGDTNEAFTNGETYFGWIFDFSQYDGELVNQSLLDTQGIWRAVITLYNISDVSYRNVVGSVLFEVGDGNQTEDPSELELDDLLEDLYAKLSKMLPVKSSDYFKAIGNIANFDPDYYNVGDIIIDRSSHYVYQVNSSKEPVKIDFGSGGGGGISMGEVLHNNGLITVVDDIEAEDMSQYVEGKILYDKKTNNYYIKTESEYTSYGDMVTKGNQSFAGQKQFSNGIKTNEITSDEELTIFSSEIVPNGYCHLGLKDKKFASVWASNFYNGKIWIMGDYINYITSTQFGISGTGVMRFHSDDFSVESNTIFPFDTDDDLGKATDRWRDLYLSGKLKDGTNEIAIADIASKAYVDSVASGMNHFKGTVADFEALNAIQNPSQGDMYWVTIPSSYHVWDGSAWSRTTPDYVVLGGDQTISGRKTFSGGITANGVATDIVMAATAEASIQFFNIADFTLAGGIVTPTISNGTNSVAVQDIYNKVNEVIDSTPTSGSNHLVTSGGVKQYADSSVASVGGRATIDSLQINFDYIPGSGDTTGTFTIYFPNNVIPSYLKVRVVNTNVIFRLIRTIDSTTGNLGFQVIKGSSSSITDIDIDGFDFENGDGYDWVSIDIDRASFIEIYNAYENGNGIQDVVEGFIADHFDGHLGQM